MPAASNAVACPSAPSSWPAPCGIDQRRRLCSKRVAGERGVRGEDVLGAAVEHGRCVLHRVSGADRHAVDHRLRAGQRGIERLGSDEGRSGEHGHDRVVVGELLAALLALFFGVGDVAGHDLERVAADAAGLLVDVLDRVVDAVDVGVGHLDRAALLVEVADLDRLEAVVGRARSADVGGEVGDLAFDLGRGRRLLGRLLGGLLGGGLGRRVSRGLRRRRRLLDGRGRGRLRRSSRRLGRLACRLGSFLRGGVVIVVVATGGGDERECGKRCG